MPPLLSPKSILSILLLLSIQYLQLNSQNTSYQQFLASTPTTFGLITVTHARNNQYQYFRKHLTRYATMQCPQMTEISVVWNNNITVQQANITASPLWKRPVYFFKTDHNSMDFRYQIPPQSQALVYFSIDDDVIISCDQIKLSFDVWKSHAIGDLGPLVSYGPRSFDFVAKTQIFTYSDQLKARFSAISLVGVSWISRFYFDLYNNQKIWQISKIRQIVRDKNNCDDIALNFIINYFFPQMLSIFVKGSLQFEINPSSQSLTTNHYKFRNSCLKSFSLILGYNPLRLIDRNMNQNNSFKFKSQIVKYIIFLKKQQLLNKYFQHQTLNVQPTSNQIVNIEQQTKKQTCQDNKKQQQISEITNKCLQQTKKLQSQLQNLKINNNQLSKQIQRRLSTKSTQKTTLQQLIQKNKLSIINNTFNWITKLTILTSIILGFALGCLCSILRSKNNQQPNMQIQQPSWKQQPSYQQVQVKSQQQQPEDN